MTGAALTRRALHIGLGATLAMVAAGAATMHAGAAGHKAAKKDHPCMLWTSDSGNAPDPLLGAANKTQDPTLDLLQGWMNVTPDGSTLQVRLSVANLAASAMSDIPTGATAADWYMTWTLDGSTYFTHVQASIYGTTSFADGAPDKSTGQPVNKDMHTDQGNLTPGSPGIVEVDVPVANVGNIHAGSLLSQPSGSTDTSYDTPRIPSQVPTPYHGVGLLKAVDSGGPDADYMVGHGCSRTAQDVRAHAVHGTAAAPDAPLTVAASAASRRLVALNSDI